jgi:hypothetical protein
VTYHAFEMRGTLLGELMGSVGPYPLAATLAARFEAQIVGRSTTQLNAYFTTPMIESQAQDTVSALRLLLATMG